jgi:hypothetical protein
VPKSEAVERTTGGGVEAVRGDGVTAHARRRVRRIAEGGGGGGSMTGRRVGLEGRLDRPRSNRGQTLGALRRPIRLHTLF